MLAAILASPAHAQNGGRAGGGSLPGTKADGESLTYTDFSAFNCSQTGFTADAVAHLDIAGHIFIDGTTSLNGKPYDTYADDLAFGPDTFNTKFFRPRLNDPPFDAGSSTYTFEFVSRVRRDDEFLGYSVTTITCAGGAFSAVNAWQPAAPPIPTGHPVGWAALALLLAAAAAARLSPRRA